MPDATAPGSPDSGHEPGAGSPKPPGRAGKEPPPGTREIQLNLTARQRRPMWLMFIPAVAIVIMTGFNVFSLLAVGFAVAGILRTMSISVVLSGDTLTYRDMFLRRRLQRAEITRVGEERHGAVRRAFVTTRKGVFYLPAPIDGKMARNPEFEEHLRIVDNWWRGRRQAAPAA